jgi:7-keto-8-aminopelargonate synthetase-like enzyme
MYLQDFYKRYTLDDEVLRKAGFNPFYHEIQSSLDDPPIIDGKQYINLASNNYLGLANDKRIKEAAVQAIEKYGMSLCATPVASGYSDLQKRTEIKMSSFLGLEDSIIYPSCFQANTGLFTVIANDEDMIVVDQYAHSSLLQGIKVTGCKIRPFLHNNLENLEKILQKTKAYRQIFVVTESVFSTEGSIAPFKEITKICEKHNALPVIDDSHGIGVLGKTGKGILEHEGITDFQGIYAASLGKALANSGGVISGKKELINYYRYYSPHLIYSTAILPSVLAGIEKVMEIIENDFLSLSSKMWKYKNRLTVALSGFGFELSRAVSPITSIIAGSSESTISLAKKLYENNIFSTPFVYPSVPVNGGRIRLIAGANLKESTIEKAIEIFKNIINGEN